MTMPITRRRSGYCGRYAALGYRGDILHYVGMSHYMRLELNSGAYYASLCGRGAVYAPCAAWHAGFRGAGQGCGISAMIWSLSYELLDQHYMGQLEAAGGGWQPRAHGLVATVHLALACGKRGDGLSAAGRRGVYRYCRGGRDWRRKFQVGEPWWWVMSDGRICLYDAAAVAAFGGSPVSYLRHPGFPYVPRRPRCSIRRGALLASSTAALVAAVKAVAPACEDASAYLSADGARSRSRPEAKRANMPTRLGQPGVRRAATRRL
jgi:hypothetical protein